MPPFRLRNGLDWVYFDLAVLAEGLVSVPLYTEDRPDNVAYIIEDAAVSLLLVQSLAQWNKLAACTARQRNPCSGC